MDRFDGRIAVITGGGTEMAREIARQLAGAGCPVAMCDVSERIGRTLPMPFGPLVTAVVTP